MPLGPRSLTFPLLLPHPTLALQAPALQPFCRHVIPAAPCPPLPQQTLSFQSGSQVSSFQGPAGSTQPESRGRKTVSTPGTRPWRAGAARGGHSARRGLSSGRVVCWVLLGITTFVILP